MDIARPSSPGALVVALAAAAVALLIAALDPAPAHAGRCKGSGKPASALSERAERRATLCVINKIRRRAGARRLRQHPALRAAALAHSRTMVARACFAHTCLGEPSLGGRLRRAGYPPCRGCAWGAEENIAYGKRRNSAPKRVLKAFMRSPAHRATMLNRRFRLVGIGIVAGIPVLGGTLDSATYTIDFGFHR